MEDQDFCSQLAFSSDVIWTTTGTLPNSCPRDVFGFEQHTVLPTAASCLTWRDFLFFIVSTIAASFRLAKLQWWSGVLTCSRASTPPRHTTVGRRANQQFSTGGPHRLLTLCWNRLYLFPPSLQPLSPLSPPLPPSSPLSSPSV